VVDGVGLPEKFLAVRWADPVAERFGFPVNSLYTETVLLPCLGPATTFCLRRIGAWAAAFPKGIEVDSRHLARSLGLGDNLGRNSAMSRTLTRLCQFDMARWVNGDLAVRTVVPPASERTLRRLSPDLVAVHDRMVRGLVAQERTRSLSSSAASSAAPEPEHSLGVSL
jgi:hypothetical protein